ncbi:MAG: MaoC/PaaZ C-terminal domain-containing protein [Dermatophilaceae bacterium]
MSPVPTLDQVAVGDQLPGRTIHIGRATLVQYAGASLDRNRIHWDEIFAKKVGLPNVIAHGMYSMGAVVSVVTDWCGDVGRIVSYSSRFTSMVPVDYESGADLVVGATVSAVDPQAKRATVEITVMCNDTPVLGKATAVVQLD